MKNIVSLSSSYIYNSLHVIRYNKIISKKIEYDELKLSVMYIIGPILRYICCQFIKATVGDFVRKNVISYGLIISHNSHILARCTLNLCSL